MKDKPGSFLYLLFVALLLSACTGNGTQTISAQLTGARAKLKHIVIIMQENRSVDYYFGTYPGADGIPIQNGVPAVCASDPVTDQCIKPFHDSNDINYGGPHGMAAAIMDINGGKWMGLSERWWKVAGTIAQIPTRQAVPPTNRVRT